MNGNIKPSYLTTAIFICPLIGYFLKNRVENFWTNKKILILWFTNIFTILISCYMTYLQAKITGVCDEGHSQRFLGTFSLIHATTIFVSAQYFVKKIRYIEYIRIPLTYFGSSVFFIYLSHQKIKAFLSDYMEFYLYDYFEEFHPMIYAFLICFIVMMVGFILFQIVSRIPILRKLVVSS